MKDTFPAVRPPETGTVLETSATAIDTSKIIGWGVDADPRNDPTYPYRDRSADDHSGQWRRPTQQQPEVELLRSVEHKQMPAVFGTSSPPKWVSGGMRRFAFRWSESNWVHWMLLIGADRVNMVEGLIEDVAGGKIPNIPKEMGLPAEWRHNKTGLIKKIAIVAVVGGVLSAIMRSRRSARDPFSRHELDARADVPGEQS